MIHFAAYDADGRIVSWGEVANQGMFEPMRERAPHLEFLVIQPLSAVARHRVVAGAIVPLVPIVADVEKVGGMTVLLRVPEPVTVSIDGQAVGEIDSEDTLSFDAPETYAVTLTPKQPGLSLPVTLSVEVP